MHLHIPRSKTFFKVSLFHIEVSATNLCFHWSSRNIKKGNLQASDFFLVANVFHFVKVIWKKEEYSVKNSPFSKNLSIFFLNHHNCLQYVKVHKIFTFHFLRSPNLDKYNYGLIAIWATSHNWRKKHYFKHCVLKVGQLFRHFFMASCNER